MVLFIFFVFVKDENRRFGRSPAEHKRSSDRPAAQPLPLFIFLPPCSEPEPLSSGRIFIAIVKDENRRFGRSPAEHKQSSDRPAAQPLPLFIFLPPCSEPEPKSLGRIFIAIVKDENRRFGRSPAEHKQSSDRPAAPNKNKTNPRENLEFVFSFQASREGSLGSFGLFFTRDYFGLKIKQ